MLYNCMFLSLSPLKTVILPWFCYGHRPAERREICHVELIFRGKRLKYFKFTKVRPKVDRGIIEHERNLTNNRSMPCPTLGPHTITAGKTCLYTGACSLPYEMVSVLTYHHISAFFNDSKLGYPSRHSASVKNTLKPFFKLLNYVISFFPFKIFIFFLEFAEECVFSVWTSTSHNGRFTD